MATRMQRSTRNVFEDLGFASEEAANLRIRADLMIELRKLIDARGLTQKAAASLFDVSQPRVSDLINGKIERFSIDMLVAMLGRAGIDIKFTTTRRRVA